MTNKQWTKSEYRTKTLLTIAPMLFFVLIVIVGIIKNCTGNGIDPIDPDPDIKLHNIFVAGHKKSLLYIGKNPNIDNPAQYFDARTEQGIQYLTHDDIYYRRRRDLRIYRYWKCYGNSQTSKTDERFSHFSEEERIW
jgi:hypothetical protein